MICPACGQPAPGIIGGLFHCDPSEPIDAIDDDPSIIRGED